VIWLGRAGALRPAHVPDFHWTGRSACGRAGHHHFERTTRLVNDNLARLISHESFVHEDYNPQRIRTVNRLRGLTLEGNPCGCIGYASNRGARRFYQRTTGYRGQEKKGGSSLHTNSFHGTPPGLQCSITRHRWPWRARGDRPSAWNASAQLITPETMTHFTLFLGPSRASSAWMTALDGSSSRRGHRCRHLPRTRWAGGHSSAQLGGPTLDTCTFTVSTGSNAGPRIPGPQARWLGMDRARGGDGPATIEAQKGDRRTTQGLKAAICPA